MKRLLRASPQQRGYAFEREVQQLFKQLGWWRVRRDISLTDRHGNRSQIDVVAGLWRPHYVECKCYTGSVPLSDVAKFASVLQLNNIPRSRGIFITTSTYVPRARTIGVRVVDGAELQQWRQQAARKRSRRWRPLLPIVGLATIIVVTQLHY